MNDSIPPNTPTQRLQWKTVSALGAATWLVTAQLSGCSDSGSNETSAGGETSHAQHATSGGEGNSGEGNSGEGSGGEGQAIGGEGTGGEGEGGHAGGVDFTTDDVAYLTQLSLIRGHLAVGYALYTQNLPELAATHMKHPRAEIYSAVEPAFAARGCAGFGANLSAMSDAVSERASNAAVTDVYSELTAAVRGCESVPAQEDPAVAAQVIEQLLRTAAVEYQLGVTEGRITNLHEYQDAWGFTQIALEWASSSAFSANPKAVAVAAQLQDLIRSIEDMWPSLDGSAAVTTSAAQLFGVASQVQIMALNLHR